MTTTPTTTRLVSYRIVDRRRSTWSRYLLFLLLCLATLVVISNIIVPTMAMAQPFTGAIILGFNERYGASDSNHLGVDVAIDAGSIIYAPIGGTVSYVGSVPAAAPSGQVVTALTITTEDGHQVTLNPFASCAVKKGTAISKGQTLGILSGSGDPSSSRAHVHLSLRIEGIYRDPSALIAATLDPAASASLQSSAGASAVPPSPPSSCPPAEVRAATASSPTAESIGRDARPPSWDPTEAIQPAAEGAGAHPLSSTESRCAPALQTQTAAVGSESAAALTPTVRSPQAPSVLARIPGVASFPSEIAVATGGLTPTRKPAWYRTLSTLQWAALLYTGGVGVSLLGVGAIRMIRRSDLLGIAFGIPLFAAREEK